ncbi:DnaJ-like protein xdj1 [Hypoxylon texense]
MAKQTIFMTGASGYIGSRITEFAIAEGYAVVGLSRSEKSDEKLKSLGATSSAKADIVIHLADSSMAHADQPYSKVIEIDGKVVDAITEGLKGSNKPLIVTSGTLVTAADPNGGETDESSPLWENPLNERIKSEQYALQQAEKGIRVVAVRLAPYVYGHAGSGIRMLMGFAAQAGEIAYIEDGAARAFLLAVKKGRAGEAYNAASETDATTRQIYETIAETLGGGTALRSQSVADAQAKLGVFLVRFATMENRASSAKARKELGWEPKEKGIVEEILTGSYVELAKKPAAYRY